jgi:hypothetical protein
MTTNMIEQQFQEHKDYPKNLMHVHEKNEN